MVYLLEDMETVKNSLDSALRSAIREIHDRMESIEIDIRRIKSAREGEREQRRRVRREVVTYHEGYSNHERHRNDVDHKISFQNDNCSNLLFREELTLGEYSWCAVNKNQNTEEDLKHNEYNIQCSEQYRSDLRQLCAQIERILAVRDCVEMVSSKTAVKMMTMMVQVRMMVPVARRLERISDQIMTTGEAILQRLQCGPRSLSNGDIPGEVAAAVMVLLFMSPPRQGQCLVWPAWPAAAWSPA